MSCPHDQVLVLYRRTPRSEGSAYVRNALRCRSCGQLVEDDGRRVAPRRTDLAT